MRLDSGILASERNQAMEPGCGAAGPGTCQAMTASGFSKTSLQKSKVGKRISE